MLCKFFIKDIKKSTFFIYKLSIAVSIIITISTIRTNISYSKEKDINKVIVEQLNETINWDDPRFYAEAKQNLARAKEIKKDARRRQTLKKAGLSNAEIKRIMREEKIDNINELTNNKIKKNTSKTIKNDDIEENNEYDEDDEDDDIIEIKKQNKLNKNSNRSVNKSGNYDFFENDKNKKQQLVYQAENDENSSYQTGQYKNQQPITNNYNTYNTYNNYNQREKDVDYTKIVPDVPVLPSGKYVAQETDEDYAIQTLAKKAGRNSKNKQNFKIFASELAKVANSPVNIKKTNKEILEEAELIARKQQIEQQLNEYYRQKQLEEEYDENNYYSYNTSNKYGNKKSKNKKVSISQQYASAINKNNKTKAGKVYAVNDGNKKVKKDNNKTNGKMYASVGASERFYASALPSMDSPLSRQNKNSNNSSQKQQIKTPIQTKEEEKKPNDNKELGNIENTEDNSSVIGKIYMTEEQIKAKNIGAPSPVLRRNTDRRIQIMPPNLAQAGAYDKNNKHLQRVAFEENIIENVFDHLLDPNSIEIVRALINKVGKTDITDAYGNTLLMHAVALKHQSLIAMLLAEGANPNFLNHEGFSPLHLASSNGDNVSLYHLLMSGGDPNQRDQDGNTALMYAVMTCNISSIKLMISLGGDITAKNAITNKSVLDYAEQNNNIEVRNFLLNKNQSTIKRRQAKDLV